MSSITASKIKVANAPCSWGAHEFDTSKTAPDYVQVLDEMAKAGYTGSELGDWGFMPCDPDALTKELKKRQLSMLAAYVPVELANEQAHQDGIERAVKTAKLLKAVNPTPYLVLADDNGKDPNRTKKAGRIQKQDSMSEEMWSTFIQGAHRVAEAVLMEAGVATVFHHHCAGYVETPEEIERFLLSADSKVINLCFDTGHYAFGGGDPLQGLEKHRGRIKHVHFKDHLPAVAQSARTNEWNYFQSIKAGIFCELGTGSVPFKKIVEDLTAHNYAGWIVVEQDVLPGMGTPLESAIRNRRFLSELGL